MKRTAPRTDPSAISRRIRDLLKSTLDTGRTVTHHEGDRVIARAALTGGYYTFTGLTGTHTLAADVTDAERLFAHWVGFVDTNRRAI
jgi:hypothetical protein